MRRIVLAAMVVLAGCGTGTAASQALAHLLLPSGRQTATIRIDLTNKSAPSFSGDIAGQPLTGKYSAAPASAAQLCKGGSSLPGAPSFAYSGSYDGKAYSFIGCSEFAFLYGNTVVTAPTGAPTGARFVFRVKGDVGSAPLSGSATWTIKKSLATSCASAKTCSITMPFSGSIGSQELNGTATITEDNSRVGLIDAKLTVS